MIDQQPEMERRARRLTVAYFYMSMVQLVTWWTLSIIAEFAG